MTELKPCPFCGASVTLENNQNFKNPNSDTMYWIDCPKCMTFDWTSYTSAKRCISAWNTRPIEDALRAEVAELTKEKPILCAECSDHILHNDGAICEMCASTKKSIITELMAENEALKSQAVVWHKYPDEKPEPSHEYEVNIPVMITTLDPISQSDFADYNIESESFWRYGTKYKGITHWAYLPGPPKGEK